MRLQVQRERAWLAAAGLVAGVMLAWPVGPAAAQQTAGTGGMTQERLAFDAADTDGDGVVSLGELARDAAHGFATLDKDGDQRLTPAELGPHDAALFSRVDTDRDGVLTFKEVMANKIRAFEAGDKDQDGGLSFEEMVTSVESEVGGAS
jgi:Ca2+-binding EF-hand superfamily protein